MAIRAGHVTTRSARYVLGPGADLPVARLVAVLLVIVPLAGLWIASNVAREGPSPAAQEIASLDPKTVLTDNTPHFLPTPVAALPPEANSGPPAPAADEQSSAAATSIERVKVANTGGAGAILRADPPKGRQVAALRDGTVLDVIEHQTQPDGSEWLHVRTPDGTEGWVFSRLVAATDQ
jgi:Bacterial SH3 domain